MQVIDPWEVFTPPAAAPACAPFAAAAPAGDGRGALHWRKGVREVRFAPGVSLALHWHGGVAGARAAHFFGWMDRRLTPLMDHLKGARLWRSIRWRLGKWAAWHKQQPAFWQIACEASAPIRLIARVIRHDGTDLLRREWVLGPQQRVSTTLRLPPLEAHTHFRLMAEVGTPVPVRFSRLELVAELPRPALPAAPRALEAPAQALTLATRPSAPRETAPLLTPPEPRP